MKVIKGSQRLLKMKKKVLITLFDQVRWTLNLKLNPFGHFVDDP